MSGLLKSDKSAVRSILTKLSKQENAEFFLYPVDSKLYPEYYKVIEKPIDISTIRENLNNYITVEDVLFDIRLIWDNCKEFNSEDSDIYQTANNFASYTEELIEEYLGKEYVLKKRKRKKLVKEETSVEKYNNQSSKKSRTKKDITISIDTSNINLSKKSIRKVINELKKNPDMELFLYPVDESAAPGYYDIITDPMDLSKIEVNLKNDIYTDNVRQFILDINQIWGNCYLYNLPKSDIYMTAQRLSNEFNNLVTKYNEFVVEEVESINQIEVVTNTTDKKRKVEVLEEKIEKIDRKVEKKDKTLVKFESIIDDIFNDPRSLPFRTPVNPDEAPGYFQIIKNPMDLSTISNYLANEIERYNDKINFLSDLLLIYSNCQLYNSDESKIYQWANELRNLTKSKFMKSFPDISKEQIQQLEKEHAEQIERQLEESIEEVPEVKVKKRSGRPPLKDSKQTNKANIDSNEITESTDQSKDVNEEDDDSFTKYKSIEEIETMISILQSDVGIRTSLVKEKGREISSQLLTNTPLPYVIVPGLYEVNSFGTIHNGSGYHDQDFIYPVGYKCTRLLYLYIVPNNEKISNVKQYNYIPLSVTSTIASSVGNKHSPKFTLTVDNGTIISDGTTFQDVWANFLKPNVLLSTVHMSASRLKRCIALLNRLSVTVEARIYLEQVYKDDTVYYEIIKSPIWLRLIHERLQSGYYDNEFDFAWDFRLVIRNGLKYYAKNSTEYQNTILLSNRFEYLFCKWILHPQDRSIDDLAKGPWDNWYHLLYYNPSNAPDNTLSHICPLCSDRYNPLDVSREKQQDMDIDDTSGKVDNSHCKRCRDAINESDVPNFENASTQTVNRYNPAYSREEHNMPSFIPLSDFSTTGWCQALRHRRGGLKQVYLSPFGFIFYSRDTALDHANFEELIDKKLLQYRQEEYENSENLSNSDPSINKRRDVGIHILPKSMHISYQGYIVSGDYQVNIDKDQKRMNTGKLINFKVPEGHKLAVYGFSNEAEIIKSLVENRENIPITDLNKSNVATISEDLAEITYSNIPKTGFYGFDIPEIKVRIEGLPAVELCSQYIQYTREYAKQKLLNDLLVQRNNTLIQGKSQTSIMTILQEERYLYEKQRLWPNTDSFVEYSQNIPKIRQNFNQLFPTYLPMKDCEVLLCVWDLLDGIGSITNEFTFTLFEVLDCLIESTNKPINIHSIIFSEICCLFTKFLLYSLHNDMNSDEFTWQSILFINPINLISWPEILHSYLVSNRLNGWNSEQSVKLLSTGSRNDYIKQLDVLCLINQSVFLYVLKKIASNDESTDNTTDLEISSKAIEVIQSIQQELLDNKHNNLSAFVNFILSKLSDVISTSVDYSNYLSYQLVNELHVYLNNLSIKWNIISTSILTSNYSAIESSITKYFKVDILDIGLAITPTVLQYNYYIIHPNNYQSTYTTNTLFSNLTNNPSIDISYYSFINKTKHLETIIELLSTKDIENWSINEKISLLHSFIYFITTSIAYHNKLIETKNDIKKSITSLTDIPSNALNNSNIQIIPKKDVLPSFTCCFSGCDDNNLSNNGTKDIKWAYVPNNCLTPPVNIPLSSFIYRNITPKVSNLYIDESIDNTKFNDKYISQDMSIHRIFAARETAIVEKSKFESKLVEYTELLKLSNNEFMNSILHPTSVKIWETVCPISLRGVPLGYDRYGSSYYLLQAQESMTLKPLGSYSIDQQLDDNNDISIDPAILIKDPTGWWGYHTGRQLPVLLSRFSDGIDSERVLKENIIIRYIRARGKLFSTTLRLKSHQKEWLSQRAVFEKKLNSFISKPIPKVVNNPELDTKLLVDYLKELEFIYTRYLELRMYIHYGMIYKNDYELDKASRYVRENYLRQLKRVKDNLIDDTYDLHPTKGWLRFDSLSQLRDLISNTIATKIHSDMYFINELRGSYYRSNYRKLLLEKTLKKFESIKNDLKNDEAQLSIKANQIDKVDETIENVDTIEDKRVDSKVDDSVVNKVEYIEAQKQESNMTIVNEETELKVDNSIENVKTIETSEDKVIFPTDALAYEVSDNVDSKINESKEVEKPNPNENKDEKTNETPSISQTQSSYQNLDPSSYSQFITGHTKAIEQLHPLTGEVLRIYPSGRIAAAFMNVSQGGISQCCNNKQIEAFGFRWRFYEGPPLEWAEVEDKFLSLEELQVIQGIRKKNLQSSIQSAETLETPTNVISTTNNNPIINSNNPITTTISNSSQAISTNLNILKPASAVPRPPTALVPQPVIMKPNVIISTVLVTPVTLKLKAELFSIFLALPEKSLKWTELENIDISNELEKEKEKEAVGLIDVLLDEKLLKKKKRREIRRLINEKIYLDIQQATTPQELLDILIQIENAIPPSWFLDYNKDSQPKAAVTFASFAIRLYTLDRSLRYEDIPGVDSIYTKYPYRPRTHYTLRCMLQCNCKGILNHQGKCLNSFDLPTRFVEVDAQPMSIPVVITNMTNISNNRIVLPNNNFNRSNLPAMRPNTNVTSYSSSSNFNMNLTYYNQLAALSSSVKLSTTPVIVSTNRKSSNDDDDSERLDTINKKKKDKVSIDIEFVQPYVPPLNRISMIEWI